MFTTIRIYRNARLLAEELVKRNSEIEDLLRPVPGFKRYYLVKTSDGCFSITVCETLAGVDESTKLSAQYLRKTLGNLTTFDPEVLLGEAVISFSGAMPAPV